MAQPVCSASRCAILTGCYSNRLGILGALGPNAQHGIAAAETTLGEALKPAGYATAIFGKWHLGHHPKFLPTRHGFDIYFGLPYSNDMHPRHPATRDYPPLPLIEGERIIALEPDQAALTTEYTARAVRFIQDHKDRPFLIYLPHTMPHVPLAVSPARAGTTGQGLYADVIAEIDWSVGQIVATLRELKLEDRTLVIFTSDDGPWLSYGNHGGSSGGLREGKGTTFEGGVRVPCIAWWPGRIAAGSTSSEPVMTIDLLPTITRLAGVAPQTEHAIDGRDIAAVLLGEAGAVSPHEALLFYWVNELHAVRSGRWKLHFAHEYPALSGAPGADGMPGPLERRSIGRSLYDLEADPGETIDRAEEEPDVVARLEALAEAARADLGDSLQNRTGRGVRAPDRLRVDAAAEAKRHEGNWVVVSMNYQGTLAEPETIGAIERTVREGRIVWSRDGRPFAATILTFDAEAQPATLDLIPEGGRFQGEPTRGIYRFEGDDRLIVCLAAPGKPRPATFEAPAGSGFTLWTFARRR